MVLPGHRLGEDSHDPRAVYLTFLARYFLSTVSACPSTLFATISAGTAWEQLMDIAQV